jgi:hypothetical protein
VCMCVRAISTMHGRARRNNVRSSCEIREAGCEAEHASGLLASNQFQLGWHTAPPVVC